MDKFEDYQTTELHKKRYQRILQEIHKLNDQVIRCRSWQIGTPYQERCTQNFIENYLLELELIDNIRFEKERGYFTALLYWFI